MNAERALVVTDDLERLGEELRVACRDVESHVVALVESAIRVGGLLTEIRQLVPKGEWIAWLNDNFPLHVGTAQHWMRLHHYRSHVLAGSSIPEALRSISDLPRVNPYPVGFATRYPDWMREEAESLRKSGRSHTAIAKSLGIHHSTVAYWLEPDSYRRRRNTRLRERRAGARALEAERTREAERTAAAAAASGLSSAYSTIRLHLEALDRAILETSDDEERRLLRDARTNAQRAEDRIVRALGIS